MSELNCPRCGAETRFRLGAYECPSCKWTEQLEEAEIPPALESARWMARPPAAAGFSNLPLSRWMERWLLLALFTMVYAAVFVLALRLEGMPRMNTEHFNRNLVMLWPWCLSWYLAALLGSTVGGTLAVGVVAAIQALFLFTSRTSLKLLSIAINALVVLWLTVITLLLLRSALLTSAAGWGLLLSIAVGIWAIYLLVRDIRWLRDAAG